ncbi:hypothetical protein ACQ4PT_052923 [Festuca glaucescens]
MDAAGTDPVFPMPSALLFPPPPSPLQPYYYYPSSSSSRLQRHRLTTTSRCLAGDHEPAAPGADSARHPHHLGPLLLTYYVFVIRCWLTWHTISSPESGSRLIISLSRRRRTSAASAHELPVVHGPMPDVAHGLGEHAIRALPTFRYRKALKNNDDTGGDTSDCAVCLGEFQEEERVRLLPSCLHVFHVDCIDTWLQGNANCPLCRAAITATTITSTQFRASSGSSAP